MSTYCSPALFEHLPVEIIRLVFEYLSPHDLLDGFEELNSRISSIIRQHPLSLPNNRRMSMDVYDDYLTYILREYSSQIVYLHLTEHRAAQAVESFLDEMDRENFLFPSLKAITIRDVPGGVYDALVDHVLEILNPSALSIHLNNKLYHFSDYAAWNDIDFLEPVLNAIPQLCSLYLRISPAYEKSYMDDLDIACSRINTHWHLHTLSIGECSCPMLMKLLGNNRLPKLRNLHIKISESNRTFQLFSNHMYFSGSCYHDLLPMRLDQTSLSPSCVPDLRCIKIKIYEYLQRILHYFEDIYRNEQLDEFKIHGRLNLSTNADFPTANNLRQWLAIPKSKQCNVQFDFWVFCSNKNDEEYLSDLFTDYAEVFGRRSCDQKNKIVIRYPNSVASIKNENENKNEEDDNSIICTIEELEIDDSEYLKDDWIQAVQNVSHWSNLRKISIMGDCTTDKDAVTRNLPILFYVAQRAPRFCELEVEGTSAFGVALSSNTELCRYISDHLEVLRFYGDARTNSFLGLAQVIDAIFSHSSSSLKKLTIIADAAPALWLTLEHFQNGLRLVFNRFPALIHFTLYCCRVELSRSSVHNWTELASEWYQGIVCPCPWSCRVNRDSFDLWL
ncbi:unnamed protein product [Rotaria socialis]|uniref:F-box domain-containing protein n=1 Tax=Rotaria socialis TaxID=392032 RepID=A0A820T6G4_9BILA|nr:unnamed protein product [Rotaria socialis]CAF4463847.1 unnamed protein product [Rotaria socialis]